jgi:hypothetical protein
MEEVEEALEPWVPHWLGILRGQTDGTQIKGQGQYTWVQLGAGQGSQYCWLALSEPGDRRLY